MEHVGDIYERNMHDDHLLRSERRLVLGITDEYVLYQLLHDVPQGTYVERDYIQDQKQVPIKEWSAWAKLARRVD